MSMKNILSTLFLTISLLIFANPPENPTLNSELSVSAAPVTSAATIAVNEGGTVEINLADYTSGAVDSYSIIAQPNQKATNNGFEDLGNGTYRYTHNGSEAPTDKFTFQATSGNDLSNISTVTLSITNVNDAPTIAAISKTVDEGSTVEITVIGKDAENSKLVYTFSEPTNGTVTKDASTGIFTYTHDGSENSSDSFKVIATEVAAATSSNTTVAGSSSGSTVLSGTGVVSITVTAVNDAPVTNPTIIDVNEGGVYAGIFDALDGDSQTFTSTVTSKPTNGKVILDRKNPLNYTYSHDGSETSEDVFTFNISDGALTSKSTVSINITGVNDAPVANNDTYYIGGAEYIVTIPGIGVLGNDTDSENDAFGAVVVTNPIYGTLILNGNGTFSYTPFQEMETIFNSDSFTYVAVDDTGIQSALPATVTFNLAKLIPVPDSYSLVEGQNLVVPDSLGLTSNDVDANNFSIASLSVVTSPKNGTLTLNGQGGGFSFQHDGSENLIGSFDYKITNSNGDESEKTFVNLFAENVNDAPTSAGSVATVSEGGEKTFKLSFNDSDSVATQMEFNVTSDPANGNIVNNFNGTVTYYHNGGETTSDSFTYTVGDGEFTTSAATASITVSAVNDLPKAYDTNSSVAEGGTVADGLEADDIETAAAALVFKLETAPLNGSITISGNVFTYTHDGSETSTDSYTFSANDGTASSIPATVSITITSVDSSPVTSFAYISTNEGGNIDYDLSSLTSDADTNSGLVYTIQVVPTNGVLYIGGTNTPITAGTTIVGSSVTYLHNSSETTTDAFAWFANDGNSNSNVSTFSIAVNAVNDVPTIISSTTQVDEQDNVDITIQGNDGENSNLTYKIVSAPSNGILADSTGAELIDGSSILGDTVIYTHTSSISANATDSFTVIANDGSADSSVATLNLTITNITEGLPTVLLSSSAQTVSEGTSSVTLTASLISNSFFSKRRDMNTAAVSANAQNALGFKYLGENAGHKYYAKELPNEWDNMVTYGEAKADALSKGGYLVVFESDAEQVWVKDKLSNSNANLDHAFWIGLNYKLNADNWVWANGFSYSGGFKDWVGGDAPTTANAEVNKGVYTSRDNDVWFNEAETNKKRLYIIEYDTSVDATQSTVVNLSVGTESGAATGSGTDYTLNASSITIASGASSASTTISIVDDSVAEGTETVTITAAAADAGVATVKGSQKVATIKILDNENATVTMTTLANKQTYTEGTDSSIDIVATLDYAKGFDTSISLTLSGTAEKGIDYSSNDDGFLEDISFSGLNDGYGLTVDSSGNYYVASNKYIYKRAASNGAVTAIAGTGGWNGSINKTLSTGAGSSFSYELRDMDIDSNGIIYLIDGYAIRAVNTANGRVAFIAGDSNWSENMVPSGDSAPANGEDARFKWLKGITVNAAGTEIYVTDEQTIRKIYSTDSSVSLYTQSANENLTNIKVVNVANKNNDWCYEDGCFQDPKALDLLSNGDLIIAHSQGLKKLTVGTQSSDPQVSNILDKGWDEKYGLVIDSADNIYFSSSSENYIYKYSSTGSLSQVIDSGFAGSGSAGGALGSASISSPMDLVIPPSGGLAFIQRDNGKVRQIDFASKIRIPAGSNSGTYTLTIKDESFYEIAETIKIIASGGSNAAINTNNLFTVGSTDYISFDSTTAKASNASDGTNGLILISEDLAPSVQITASESNIVENGGVSTVSFQIGGASESGTKMDLDDGLKNDFPFIGTYQDHKYYIAYEWLNWDEAKLRAEELGGYLLTINNADENTWVVNNLGENYKWDSYWLGYNDKDTEGTFVWANGSEATYTNWYSGEPNNAGDEDVAEFNGYEGKWNDLPSNEGRFFIIEFSGTVSAKDVVIPYVVTSSTGFETASGTDAIYTTSGNVTIPAGQSKVDLTVTAVQDTVNEITESLTYTITNAITDGTYDAANSAVQINIIDDEAPVLEWASNVSSNIFSENGGSVTITATIKDNKIKANSSKINLTITDGGATIGEDYSISELAKVSTLAGSTSGFKDGTGADSKFWDPSKVISDAAGNIYVADSENNVIRKITADGVVSTYAGNGEYDWLRSTGNKMNVGFSRPSGLAFNNAGNEMFIIENGSNRISKIDSSGDVLLVSGNGEWGSNDGGPMEAMYKFPTALAFDSDGHLYVGDENTIRKLQLNGSEWTSSTYAGSGNWGFSDGVGTDAEFGMVKDIVIDKSGSEDVMYVADDNRIRKITLSDASVTTYANTNNNWGQNDGSLESASFENINALTIDSSESSLTMYATDDARIRKITADGVETLTGKSYGFEDGLFGVAKFKNPRGITVTANGIYISDTENNKIRKIDLKPSITIAAGASTGSITINGIDDQLWESDDEAFTISVQSLLNVDASSTLPNIVTKISSDDSAPTIKLSANDDVLEEGGGTATLTVSLADAFSSAKSDMSASQKADFYYLGEYQGSRYYASKDDNDGYKSYSDALLNANALGGQLAVVTSAGENDFITNNIYDKDPRYSAENDPWLNHWIGHEYADTNGNEEYMWKWTNGAQSDYENWGWEYNPDYIDMYYTQIRYNGMWFNGESNWESQYVLEFSSAVSDIDASAFIEFSGTGTSSDYTTSIGAPTEKRTVTISKGQPSASITITGIDDSEDEAIENIIFTMSKVDGSPLVLGTNSATLSISDNELPAVTLTVSDEAIGEVATIDGTTYPTFATLTASIANPKLNPVNLSIDFANSGSQIAIFGNDFGSEDLNKVSTLAGDGNDGYLDGDGDEAEFSDDMRNAAVDASGNMYVADFFNHVIRKITPSGQVSTFAGNGIWWNEGDIDQTNGDKLNRSLSHPSSVKFDNNGNMFVVESQAHRISKINMSTGELSRYIGKTEDQGDDNGNQTEARFNGPQDIAFDSNNNMYVLDRDNTKIRKVIDDGTNRIVSDYAGNGNYGETDGDALSAELGGINSMVIDSSDNLFFTAYDRIRKVSSDGVTVSTVAGEWGGNNDGFGKNAAFSNPKGLAIDGNNNIFVADANNRVIRMISDINNSAKVTTISGTGEYDYQDGTSEQASYRSPSYVAYKNGILFVVDSDDNRIRQVQLIPKMTIAAGQTSATYNIRSLNDVVFENDESIKFTSSSITGGTYSEGEKVILLKSDELIPKIELGSESLVLNEADGTLELEVFLTDASGASSNWENTELPSEASEDFEFMGEFEGNKYYFSRYSQTWENANQAALELGGQLLVIESIEENEFISSIMIHNATWIGTKRVAGSSGNWENVYAGSTYQNFADDIYQNGYGYAITWGNKWYNSNEDDYRNYIIEYGPVTSSEEPSSVNIVFGAGTATKQVNDGDGADFKISAETFTIPAGQQSATLTLTGLQDSTEEAIENILISLALPENPTVALGDNTSLDIKISDDEAPVVTFTTSALSIPENGGSVVVTANLSNAKLNPTTIGVGLAGTSTPIRDYFVSSIFAYNTLAGSTDNPGAANGVGANARFDLPLDVTEYLDGSYLVADRRAHVIKKVDSDGTVTSFIGSANNRGPNWNLTGDASDARLQDPENVTADLNTGNVYWSAHDRIYVYTAADKKVYTLANMDSGDIGKPGGMHFVNNTLYFSDLYKHTINKLVVTVDDNGKMSVSNVIVAGNNGTNGWFDLENNDKEYSFDQAAFTNPGKIFMDVASNKMYVTQGNYVDQPDWQYGALVQVLDFNTSKITSLPINVWQSVYAASGQTTQLPTFRGMDMDGQGNLYLAVSNYNSIVKVAFENGVPYLSHTISNSDTQAPTSIAVSGAALAVANAKGSTIGKVGLGATIEIPSMQTTGNITLQAFKDPFFEEDEIIDVNVAGIDNGTVASNDISEVTIVEATRLTLVEDAPFQGVENGKVSWGDYDKDGDMDLALMGSASTGTITNVYINNDGVFVNTNQNFTKYIGGDIEFVDVNQDGYLDVAVSGNAEGNIRKSELYINNLGSFFTLMEDYNVVGLSQSEMEWGDLDNDGDPDLIISGIDASSTFRTYYYTNLGNFNFLNEGLFYDNGVINGETDIVDADQDGDNDLFTNGSSGDVTNMQTHRNGFENTYYRDSYEEDGQDNNDSNQGGFNVGPGFKNGNTIYADIDGDGELDFLAMGEDEQGKIQKMSNLAALNNLPSLKNVDFDFADYNNDGQSDLIIAGEDPNSGLAVTKLYTTFPALFGSVYGIVESDLTISGLRKSSADWIDYDKDGDLDLFLTGLDDTGKAKAMLYKAENTNNLNTAPNKVTGLTATHNGVGGVKFDWEKPTDNSSSEFRYDIRIGTTSGGDDIIYSNSNPTNGSTLINIPSLSTLNSRSVILNPGTYYASVQAIDGGNIGGAFSDEVEITLEYDWKLLNLGGIIDRRLIPKESTQLEFLDMDGDGDKDLISTNVGMVPNRNGGPIQIDQQAINIYAFDNEVFVPVLGKWQGESNFDFGDFNNDGQKDLIIAVEESGGTRIQVLLNTRLQDDAREDDTSTPENEGLYREFFREHNPFEGGDNFLEDIFNIEFAIKDLDNDGLVEIIAAGQSSKLSNEATTIMSMVSVVDPNPDDNGLGFDDFRFSDAKSVVDESKLNNLSFASYDFGDIDSDGDFDFLISGYSFDGYKTILFENKRKVDADGVTVQPIEVYFEEKVQDFVSVKQGTADFVDFDADGNMDILFSGQSANGDLVKAYKNLGTLGFTEMNVGLPAVREGRFVFGDFDSNGYADVLYSGTVAGQGKITKSATWVEAAGVMVDSPYDFSFYQDANIGVADFDGDLDADLVITGKNKYITDSNDISQYISDIFINVRGFAPPANSGINTLSSDDTREGSPLKKSIGVKKVYGFNSAPNPPTSVDFQRQRLSVFQPEGDNNGEDRISSAADSNKKDPLFELVISWAGATDNWGNGKRTPAAGLTYSVRIGSTPGGEEILASGSDIDGVKAVADAGNAENNLSWKLNVPMGDYYVAVQSIDASFVGSAFTDEEKYTVTSAFKLGDSNGDDGINILDLTTNLDYILGKNPKVFVSEVADVNNDGKIDVTDISAIVNLILSANSGIAEGANYDPYDWDYFSDKPVGQATLVHTDNRIYLENEKPVTSLQFSIDSTVQYELSEELKDLSVVNFVKDGKRTFLIYSYNNQPINELTNILFDYVDVNESEEFKIEDLRAGTNDGLVLDLRYSDERFFDSLDDSVQMYPNPAVSNINLLTNVTKKVKTLQVNIYNVLGVSVYNTTIDTMGRLNDLDVSMLSSGLYTVQVKMVTEDSEEIMSVHKLIKK